MFIGTIIGVVIGFAVGILCGFVLYSDNKPKGE